MCLPEGLLLSSVVPEGVLLSVEPEGLPRSSVEPECLLLSAELEGLLLSVEPGGLLSVEPEGLLLSVEPEGLLLSVEQEGLLSVKPKGCGRRRYCVRKQSAKPGTACDTFLCGCGSLCTVRSLPDLLLSSVVLRRTTVDFSMCGWPYY